MEENLFIEALNDSDHNDSDVDDAAILHILHDEENLGNRGILYGRLNLENITDAESRSLFRFYKNDIIRLAAALGIPERIITKERINVSSMSFYN